ncbi:MAG TPA: DUF1508 domain-containing protein [Mesorhizobium sp.]
MAQRTYPSYWLYKDNRGEWRWSYDAKNGETIAVSSEGYNRRIDAQRGIDIMKASHSSSTWYPADLENAA